MSQAGFKFKGGKPNPVEADLKRVIDAFAQLQDDRYTGDYDVRTMVIRKVQIVQDHLLTMFGARRV